MIFSENRIKRAISNQQITIAPFDPNNHKSTSLTLTLSNKFEYKEIEMNSSEFLLPAKESCIAFTHEKITLSSKVCAILSVRNSFARKGLIVLFGDTFCESNTNTHLSVMIYNPTNTDIKLTAGDQFIKIIFLDVK